MNRDERYRLVLLLACLVLFFYKLGGRDFWDPDEPRYAGIARGIVEGGDWLNLTDNGRPYTQKPPLFFWILAAGARLGSGVTPLGSRLPSSLLALLSVLLLYRLGRDLVSPRAGLFGALVLATTQRFFLEARWVHIDMLLTFLVLVALDSAWRALEGGERWRWALAYLAAGLGCLAKGPVAVAIPAAALLTFLASVRELPRMRDTRWWIGVPAALLPALIWLGASSHSAGFDLFSVIRVQVFQRFQEGVHHPRPFYYYFYSLPLEFLPWTPFLAGAFATTFPGADRSNRRALLYLYGWFLGGLALFSVAAEKRPSYLLPILPALALLLGIFLDDFLVRWNAAQVRKWVAGPVIFIAAVCLGGVLWIPHAARGYPGLGGKLVALAFLYLVACAGTLTALWQGKRGMALITFLAGIWIGYLWIAGSLLPYLNDYKSARPFCERIVSRIGAARLGMYGDYRPAYAFYTRRRLEIILQEERLKEFLAASPAAYCLVNQKDHEPLRSRMPLRELDREAVGQNTYLLVTAGEGSPGVAPAQPR